MENKRTGKKIKCPKCLVELEDMTKDKSFCPNCGQVFY